MKKVRKSGKKFMKVFMLMSLFSSYLMPIVSYGEEIPTESSEPRSALESSHESTESTIHSKETSNTEESQTGANESSQSIESSEPVESDKTLENTRSTESLDSGKEYIQEDTNSDSEKKSKEQPESGEQVQENTPSQNKEDGSTNESEGQVLEVKNVEYEAEVIAENVDIFSAPGNSAELEKSGTTSDYINNIVTVRQEAHSETQTWANIFLENENLGWVKVDALEKIAQERMTTFSMAKVEEPIISYSTHVQSLGWQDAVEDGGLSGTVGKGKRLEAIKINVDNIPGLNVQYSTHVQSNGWMDWVSNGQLSGTTNQQKRLEAIKIKLSGEQAANYDIYYRVHAESFGWLDWAKNGEEAGTAGLSKRLEAIEIVLVGKGGKAPGATNTPFVKQADVAVKDPSVTYQTHVQQLGWQDLVKDGALAGTEGQGKRIEAIKMDVTNVDNLGIKYSGHVQGNGWMDWVTDGKVSGTTGQNKRLEAIKIQLTGSQAQNYNVYYRVHSEHFGWLGWAKNGEIAGLEGYGFRAEAIEIKVLPKEDNSIDTSDNSNYVFSSPTVNYASHIQTNGWLPAVKNGQISGTTGQAKQLEAIKSSLKNAPFDGNINYRSHVQKDGWQNSVTNGQISGTVGQQKRLEAIEVNLSGDMAKYYDVYYRTHIEDHGWLGWAKNGMRSGSEGISKRMEAIEIKLVKKNMGAAVDEDAAFKEAEEKKVVYLDPGHGGYEGGASYSGTQEKTINMSVSEKIKSRLEKLGYTVVMSRTGDEAVSLIDRSAEANAVAADIFVSVHHNAMPGSTTVRGIETYYYEYDPNYPSKINKEMHNDPERIKESAELATEIHEALIENTGAFDRGVRRNTFAVLRESSMPAVLLELGYMSSPSELAMLKTDAYQNTLADAVVEGIHNYFIK